MNWLRKLFGGISSTAKTIINFILPIAESHAGQLLASALPIAESIVVGIATQGLTGTQARDAAVTQLKTQLISQGYATAADISTRVLNLAVEMAANKVVVQS
jgi:hypothetical protein